jgi:hypothetical protein
MLDYDLPFLLQFPHPSYKRAPFQITNNPTYSSKNLQHKKSSIKPLPPLLIHTMPFNANTRIIANKGSGNKVPPSTTVLMSKSPPESLQMSGAEHPLAKGLQTKAKMNAPYPPI